MENETPLQERTKGISLELCIEKAEEYIKQNGMCLFVLDVQGSQKLRERINLQVQLESLVGELNALFEDFLPENNLTTVSRTEKGFNQILGDGIVAGISNADVIPATAQYIKDSYPFIPFYYNVAVDGYDDEAMRTIK